MHSPPQANPSMEGNLDKRGTTNPSDNPTKASSAPYLSLMVGLGPYIYLEGAKPSRKPSSLKNQINHSGKERQV